MHFGFGRPLVVASDDHVALRDAFLHDDCADATDYVLFVAKVLRPDKLHVDIVGDAHAPGEILGDIATVNREVQDDARLACFIAH